jgi:hypothetical protein
MYDTWARITSNLVERVGGPMSLRLILQPTIATILAIRAGLKDAREGNPPYFWSVLTDPAHRQVMLRDGWKSIGKVFIAALVLDVAYQLIVERFVYPGEAIIVAIVLAIVPYLVLRGLATRLARRR